MLTKTASPTTITLWNGREIPRLGMGCWAIGGPFFAGDTPLGWGDVDDDESVEAINRAIELGINYFDTAALYGDGLSAAALNQHLETYHRALMTELAKVGLPLGTPMFVRHSRVKVMDEIARLTDCEAALFVCGERPGLGFADSLSAYYISRPGTEATDANREVISNIKPRGLEPARAARLTAAALQRVLRDRRSGVA